LLTVNRIRQTQIGLIATVAFASVSFLMLQRLIT
jgi:hypothetical protein